MLTQLTYKNTKHLHDVVDGHKFVSNIHFGSKEADYYIDTVQKVLSVIESSMFPETQLYRNLKRMYCKVPVEDAPLYDKIKQDCEDPVLLKAQVYMWYLSLMAGGRLLRDSYDDTYKHLFEFRPLLRKRLKNFINSSVDEKDYDKFISGVSSTYILIADHFDDFYNSEA